MVRMGAGTGNVPAWPVPCRQRLQWPLMGKGKTRTQLIEVGPRRGEDLDPGKAWHVRVVEYEVPDRPRG